MSSVPARLQAGCLLVALPSLNDPNFDRTVVLVLAHDPDDGALGVVLNRPSDTAVGDPLPRWAPLAAQPGVVFLGGPVGATAAIGVARGPGRPGGGWAPVAGHLGTVDLGLDPDELTESVDAVRVFSGYAGWVAGQLESEIDLGAWMVVDGAPDDVLCADPAGLWRMILRRQGGRTAWLANWSPDPRMN
ncbi:MAG: YqgE/AlgH family protein [Actinomycetota bacterium]|nr:YqgE/AlgH family protein [Actinomycetota bacterium]